MPASSSASGRRRSKAPLRKAVAEQTLVLVKEVPQRLHYVHRGKQYDLRHLDAFTVRCPTSSAHDYSSFVFELSILHSNDLRSALDKEKGELNLASALFLTSTINGEKRHFQVMTPPLVQYATLIRHIPQDLLFAALLLIIQTRAQSHVETLKATLSSVAELVRLGMLKRRKARNGTYVARVYAGEPEFSARPNEIGGWTPVITISRWPETLTLEGSPASSERAAIASAKSLAENEYRDSIRRFKSSSQLLE